MKKTALQEFLEQIVLKQINGSLHLIPAITDKQMEIALENEREQILDAFVAGDERGTKEVPFNCEQYFSQNYDIVF